MKRILFLVFLITAFSPFWGFAQAGKGEYLNLIKDELVKTWPNNRTVNLVFHGHSVPSGYFRTPEIRTLESYPYQTLKALKEIYPTASVNVIVTAIGGENSEQGEKRFVDDVLTHKPDVLFIDYALNDRGIGLSRSAAAMEKMIRAALERKIKVILLTPSPDLRLDITASGNELEKHACQLAQLAKKYDVGLADSYLAFKELVKRGENLEGYMAQSNHPNEKGHQVIAGELIQYFE